ncbi:MAG: fibro-slime domain-containing protein [Phycisphaeraceae bacterium]|nr:fibro-slime domain-containing protein [Phycisphaeraceae bacterium]|tara:strand:+ start:31 stop:936 length:906 start_codon:yes stop_codon:yes gene_type:complete
MSFIRTTTTVFAAGLAAGFIGAAATGFQPAQQDEDPETLELTGVVRDFHERTAAAGHPDFERRPSSGFGLYCGNVATQLDADGKPVFSGSGFKVGSQWRDASGRPICWHLFDSSLGDSAGSTGASDSGGIQSDESFRLWYRDDPRINRSKLLEITLDREADGSYVFDSNTDAQSVERGGFFPIDHELFGNSGGSGPDHNYHFTFELQTEFTYEADGAQVFTFRGDDDVWVYINRELVIDLGGVHGAKEQTVDLNRLGLQDGEEYELSFFFAERHRTASNFRMTTNLKLRNIELPTVTAAYD